MAMPAAPFGPAGPFGINPPPKNQVDTNQILRTNLVQNPSFEVNETSWWSGGGFSGDRVGLTNPDLTPPSTEYALFGTKSLRLNVQKVGTPASSTGQYYLNGVTPFYPLMGQTYTFSIYIYTPIGSGIVNATVGIRDYPTFAFLASTVVTTIPGVWVRGSVTYTATNANPSWKLSVSDPNINAATPQRLVQYYWVDGGLLELGSKLLPYFDGDSEGCRWTGTKGLSTSVMYTNNNPRVADGQQPAQIHPGFGPDNLYRFTSSALRTQGGDRSYDDNIPKAPVGKVNTNMHPGMGPASVTQYNQGTQGSTSGLINTIYTLTVNATLGFTGAVNKVSSRVFTGGLSFVGNIIKGINKGLSGALSFTGNIAKTTFNVLLFTASLGFAGSLSRRDTRSLSGGLSFSGNINRQSNKLFTGVLSLTGSFNKVIRKSIGSTLSFVGSILTGTLRHVSFTAVLSFTGGFKKTIRKTLTGSISFVGTFVNLLKSFLRGNVTLSDDEHITSLTTNQSTADLDQEQHITSLATDQKTSDLDDDSRDIYLQEK